jgi:hypothetical protein
MTMIKRIAYILVAVLLVVGAGAVVYRMVRRTSTPGPGTPGEPPVAANRSSQVLLNEVMFRPSTGERQWVELINASAESATLHGAALVNQAGARYDLPQPINLPAGGTLLIPFDQTDFLHPEKGSLALVVGSATLDDTYWSTVGGPSVNLARGGRIPEFVPGTSLGRPPLSTERGAASWTIFDPADTTPGKPNPFPAVTQLMPLSGAVLRSPTPNLFWYGVPTARRYQVQIATDNSFASPIFDQSVAASGQGISVGQITTSSLSPGRYLWRVRAMFGDQGPANGSFSRPAILWIEAAPPATAQRALPRLLAHLLGIPIAAAQADTPSSVHKVLPVPFIMQRKDTPLLSLEADEAGNTPWDAPWAMRVQASTCARASIAMITAFYRGNLSQDRLTYEVQKDWSSFPWPDDPTRDLDVDVGWMDDAITAGMTFALGGEPRTDFRLEDINTRRRKDPSFDFNAEYWKAHQAAIDANSPVLATTRGHAFVIVGYGEDSRGKYFIVNDPMAGQYDWLLSTSGDSRGDLPDTGGVDTSFFPPPGARGRFDEPELVNRVDTDRDGILDFDELRRFGTSPRMKDSDSDGVDDKNEIRAWVFDDVPNSYARNKYQPYKSPASYMNAADLDRDGTRMEMDVDSDGGGCLDGMEDLNFDGKHQPDQKEFYNFDKDDDPCIKGVYEVVVDSADHGNGPAGLITSKIRQTAVLSLLPQPDGTLKGLGAFSYTTSSEAQTPPTGCLTTTTSPEPTRWSVTLEGTSRRLPDGSTELTVTSTPTQGPMHPFQWTNACPPGASGSDQGPMPSFFGFGPLTLTNGKFEVRTDTPLGPNRTGTQYTLIRLEQKTAEGAQR